MKILVGYDGGGIDNKVLQLAKQQAKANNASVEILRAADLQPKNEKDLAKQEEIEKDLQAVAAAFADENIPCETSLKTGLAAGELILEAAQAGGADMIVIGVRKRSRVGKFVFGSSSQLVILDATCPVLIWKDN